MIKKNLTRGLQFACGVAVVAAAVATTFKTNDVVASASAPSGTCALVASQSAVGQGTVAANATTAILGTITFNGNFAIDLQNVTRGNSSSNETSTASGTNIVGAVRASGAYPVTLSGREISPSEGTQDIVAYLEFLPTNNNQTYLVTSFQGPEAQWNGGASFTGVCQVQ